MSVTIEEFTEGQRRIPEVLAQMGYSALREGQETPINCIMAGKDTICILPTSFGKSACFAIPTVAMRWHTVVFSPLVALMRDQVQSMNRMGIRAGCVNSSQQDAQNYTTLREWAEGRLQMMYVAPERISNPQFQQALQATPVDLVVLDEAHVLSQAVSSFRPSYRACGELVSQYNPKVIAAFTATATEEIVEDVKKVLHMNNACLCRYYVARNNIELHGEVLPQNSDLKPALVEKLKTIKGSCIVYCQTVREVGDITEFLQQQGESVTFYHGQITAAGVRESNMDAFMSGRARICVATNAFGMGVDKPDIEGIIHIGLPSSIEAVAQETGRAARDGRRAVCYMFDTPASRWTQEFFWDSSNPDGDSVRRAYQFIKRAADTDGIAYVKTKDIVDAIGSKSSEGALNFLQSRGCVRRFTPQTSIYTFGDKSIPLDDFPKPLKALVQCIREFGIATGESDEGTIYQIDFDYLQSKLGQADSTVKSKIRQLIKDNLFNVTLPFTGKATQIVTPPTVDDLTAADEKRAAEWKKIEDVRAYVKCKDSEKHAFLLKYFQLNS